MIFEDVVPQCTVLATGTPYQSFPKRWWSTRTSAVKTVEEIVKIVFYLLGGRFKSNDAMTFEKRPLSKSALICSISALRSSFNPRNNQYIPVVKILTCLDLERN